MIRYAKMLGIWEESEDDKKNSERDAFEGGVFGSNEDDQRPSFMSEYETRLLERLSNRNVD